MIIMFFIVFFPMDLFSDLFTKELISKEICWAEHDNMSIQPLPIDMIPNNI